MRAAYLIYNACLFSLTLLVQLLNNYPERFILIDGANYVYKTFSLWGVAALHLIYGKWFFNNVMHM